MCGGAVRFGFRVVCSAGGVRWCQSAGLSHAPCCVSFGHALALALASRISPGRRVSFTRTSLAPFHLAFTSGSTRRAVSRSCCATEVGH